MAAEFVVDCQSEEPCCPGTGSVIIWSRCLRFWRSCWAAIHGQPLYHSPWTAPLDGETVAIKDGPTSPCHAGSLNVRR